jgi:hypothetical protein
MRGGVIASAAVACVALCLLAVSMQAPYDTSLKSRHAPVKARKLDSAVEVCSPVALRAPHQGTPLVVGCLCSKELAVSCCRLSPGFMHLLCQPQASSFPTFDSALALCIFVALGAGLR